MCCERYRIRRYVVIGDLEDVDLLIDSLQRLKADWYGDSDE